MPVVKISARLIHFPLVCPCCMERADTTVELSAVRERGVRVVRSEEKGWEVPYCQQCLRHIHLERRAEHLREEARRAVDKARWQIAAEVSDYRVRKANAVARAKKNAFSVRYAGITLVGLVGGGASWVIVYLLEKHGPLAFLLGIFIALAILTGTGLLAYRIVQWSARVREDMLREAQAIPPPDTEVYKAEAQEVQREAQSAAEDAKRAYRLGCRTTELAASYEGWSGTIHTFIFDNPDYARAFEDANPGKCLVSNGRPAAMPAAQRHTAPADYDMVFADFESGGEDKDSGSGVVAFFVTVGICLYLLALVVLVLLASNGREGAGVGLVPLLGGGFLVLLFFAKTPCPRCGSRLSYWQTNLRKDGLPDRRFKSHPWVCSSCGYQSND